jgi:uncharacterized circularly permuted ATP-grasp superfamily protein
MLEEAIAHYHSLLDAEMARASWRRLTEEMRAGRLYFGERPLSTVLRPRMLSREQYALLRGACDLVAGAARKLARRALDGTGDAAAIRRVLSLTPQEDALIAMTPGYEDPSAHSRMDTFITVDGSSLQFVEYNAESPAAIAYEDNLSQAFLALPVVEEFQKRYRLTDLPARHRMIGTLLGAWRAANIPGEPRVAILDWSGLPTASEFELFRDYFEQHGLPTIICTPDDLRFENGMLYAASADTNKPLPITIVYKRVLTSEFLEHYRDDALSHPLVQAYERGAIVMVNNFRAKLLHKKSIFALLTDERFQGDFSAEERAAVERHVPWTRLVQAGKASYAGDTVDLLAFARANRERLLLKPNDDYGGKGITIGWESTAAQWDAALKAALEAPFVVQERVRIAYEDYPTLVDDEVVIGQRLVDSDPFLFGTDVEGCLCRLSTVTLLNVTAGGGSTVPVFVVDER